MKKIVLLFNTLKFLKRKQIFYLLWNRLKVVFPEKNLRIDSHFEIKPIKWEKGLYNSESYRGLNTFSFLNISHSFPETIDWNYDKYGKLWTYNLNYFDYLNQEHMPKNIGISLVNDYVKNEKTLKDGKEPYPISLRGINWVKFLSKNEINSDIINQTLYHHYRKLIKNLEYHLLGNHLLENAFSLLFGAYYFQDDKLYSKSKNLLISELNEQILKDGAHFELSPMYHQVILSRLLDSIHLIKLNSTWKKNDLLSFLEKKAGLMISWLQNITFRNGIIPMVNDSTYNIAPSSNRLFSYSKSLGLNIQKIPLSDSFYRKISSNNYELLIDVGNIGPSYQPGHAHSDTFNFELVIEGKPIFVDTGISTYEKNAIRQSERSTSSHNTVKIGEKDQTQVWGGFRVARRAKITHFIEKNNFIEASHDGYFSDGYKHTRSFSWARQDVVITDKINKSTLNNAKAFFHLHSSIKKPLINGNNATLESLGITIKFEKAYKITLEEYQLSSGFNKTSMAYKIVVVFDKLLKTIISI